MIIVVVIMAIASVAVVNMVAQVGSGQTENSDLQVGAQLLQECGEWIVSQHRRDQNFFDSTLVSSSSCFGLSTYSGFGTPNVVVSDYSGMTGCPTGATCKLAAITITKSGASMNTINVMLVKYN